MKFRPLLILLILLSVLLSACTPRPRNVLSKKKMTEVLYDLHKTDGVVLVKGYNFNHDEELKKFYESTLLKHGVTQAQFDSSLVWYTDNPKRFNKIYPRVIARLQRDIDSYSWLDQQAVKPKLRPEDISPYNLDSLALALRTPLPACFSADALMPLNRDTSLYYIFPLPSIDSLSLVVASLSSDTISTSVSQSVHL